MYYLTNKLNIRKQHGLQSCGWFGVCYIYLLDIGFLAVAVPQVFAGCYKSCHYIFTFRFFTKNEGEFFSWGAIVKLGKYFVYFGIVVVSDGILGTL